MLKASQSSLNSVSKLIVRLENYCEKLIGEGCCHRQHPQMYHGERVET